MIELRRFDESPDVGHPRCLCSYCGERIEAVGDDEDAPGDCLRVFITKPGQKRAQEMRFHDRCFNEVRQLHLLDANG